MFTSNKLKYRYRKVECIEFWEVHSGKPGGDAELSEPAPKLMTIHYDQESSHWHKGEPVKAVTMSCKGYTLNGDAAKKEPHEKSHVVIQLDSENGSGGKAGAGEKHLLSPFDPKLLSGHLYFSGTKDDTALLLEYLTGYLDLGLGERVRLTAEWRHLPVGTQGIIKRVMTSNGKAYASVYFGDADGNSPDGIKRTMIPTCSLARDPVKSRRRLAYLSRIERPARASNVSGREP